jgi:hypothetical protein
VKRFLPVIGGALLAVVHFAASLAIVPLTLRIGESLSEGPANSLFFSLLAGVTKVLYFPIISLALYPRHWFPGDMITIPIAANSLLWGIGLMIAIWLGRRTRCRWGR